MEKAALDQLSQATYPAGQYLCVSKIAGYLEMDAELVETALFDFFVRFGHEAFMDIIRFCIAAEERDATWLIRPTLENDFTEEGADKLKSAHYLQSWRVDVSQA